LAILPKGTATEVIAREVNCFHEHQHRMDYRAGRRAGEPIGSGPVEATCRQAQCRFKRPGQFGSQTGDEALLCLETFWQRPLASPVPSHRLQPCKKLTCARKSRLQTGTPAQRNTGLA
jgi:hypothetical protein